MKIILEYIPITLVIFLSLLSPDVKNIWFTTLGKIFAIVLIVFYARINKYIGLGVCMIMIYIYNSYDFHILEGLENAEEGENEAEMDEEQQQLLDESNEVLNDIDVEEAQIAASEIMGETIDIPSEENSASEIEKQVAENQKISEQNESDIQEAELESKKIELEQAKQEQNEKMVSEQMDEQKKRSEIQFLQDMLKQRSNYSQSIISKAEKRLEELLFDENTNSTTDKDTFKSMNCSTCKNTTLGKIETFVNLMPRLTRV
jgi:flagellar biosynthesis GTPase FlhF